MPFVLTGRGRITGSFPQCPLFPGLLGICLYVGKWALLLSLRGSQLHFGPCSLVPIPPFPFALKRPLFLPMFLIFLFRAPQSIFDGPKWSHKISRPFVGLLDLCF